MRAILTGSSFSRGRYTLEMVDLGKPVVGGPRSLVFSILAAAPITAYWAYPHFTGDYNSWGMLLATFICVPASALFGLATLVSSIISASKSRSVASYVAATISLITVAYCGWLLLKFR